MGTVPCQERRAGTLQHGCLCNARLPCICAPWVRSCCSLLTSGALPFISAAGIVPPGGALVQSVLGQTGGPRLECWRDSHSPGVSPGVTARPQAPVSCFYSEIVSDGTERPTQKRGPSLTVDVFRDNGQDQLVLLKNPGIHSYQASRGSSCRSRAALGEGGVRAEVREIAHLWPLLVQRGRR